MPDFQGALLFDSAINLEGLTRGAANAKNILDRLGSDATKTFQNDIARGLANAVRPENFAADVAKSKALLKSIGIETSKTFETTLGRKQAKALLQPFIDETTTLKGRFKEALNETFSLKNIAGGLLTAGAIAGVLRGLFDIGKATVNIARDAVETRNKFDVIFGDLKGSVRSFANTYAQEVGRSRIQTENFLSTINGIFTTVGIAGKEAAEFSKNITKLTFDLASFFNTTDDEALTALRSGLIGESEPLRRFNVFLSEARVAQEALAQGIKKSSKELTDQEKVFLRYQIILKDTAAAQGDAIRTSDSLANQQKRLSANFTNLGEILGNVFVPKLADATASVNKFLEALTDQEFGTALKNLLELSGIKFNAADIGFGLGGVLGLGKKSFAESEKGFISAIDKTKEALQAQSAEIKKALDLQDQMQAKLNLETVTIEAHQEIWEKSQKQLEAMVELGGKQAEAARKELNKREEIEQAAARTRKELEAIAAIKLPDYLTKSKQAFEFGKIRGVDNKAFSDAQFKKDLEILLNIKLTPLLKINAKKISGLEKVSDDLRGALSDIAFPVQAFLVDLERLGIATQSELVGLADLFDRGIGDILDSFFKFKDQLSGGTLLGSFLGGTGFVSAVAPFVSKLLDGFLGRSEEMQRIDAIQRESAEQAAQAALQLKDSMEQLRQVFLTLPVIELENELRKIGDEIEKIVGVRNITAESLEKVFGLELQAQDLRRQIEDAESRGLFDLAELLRKDLDKVEAELAKFGFSVINLTAAQLDRLRELTKGSDEFIKSLERFGQFANNFSGLIEQLNFKFDVLNIDDPLKKLDLLAKGIRDKFKAIVPTTDAGIRDLIAKGLEALEAGGQTLVDFLKGLDLEELTADQFRDFLQLLNQLANEAKSKVDDIGKATDEDILVSAVRQITFTQGNKLIDELTTMRIIQTQMLDIMRGASLRAPDFKNFGIPGNRIIVVNGNDVRQGNAEDLRGINRRQLELAIAASRAQGMN